MKMSSMREIFEVSGHHDVVSRVIVTQNCHAHAWLHIHMYTKHSGCFEYLIANTQSIHALGRTILQLNGRVGREAGFFRR